MSIFKFFNSYFSQEMDKIPEPQVLTLDPNDENIILEIPDDKYPDEERESAESKKEKKVRHSH